MAVHDRPHRFRPESCGELRQQPDNAFPGVMAQYGTVRKRKNTVSTGSWFETASVLPVALCIVQPKIIAAEQTARFEHPPDFIGQPALVRSGGNAGQAPRRAASRQKRRQESQAAQDAAAAPGAAKDESGRRASADAPRCPPRSGSGSRPPRVQPAPVRNRSRHPEWRRRDPPPQSNSTGNA